MAAITDKLIVVPWDFSEMSQEALAKAADLADSQEQLRVVHVTPFPEAMEPGVLWAAYSEDDISQKLLEKFDEDLDRQKFPDLKLQVLFGDAASEIASYADQHDAGLIVISSHGRGGVSRFFLGSVAERVVRLAHCPVLVLRSKPPA